MKSFTVDEEQRQRLGYYLNRRRRMNSLSVSDTAEFIGVKIDYIRALERGRIAMINPLVLMKLGELLGVSYMFLYMMAGYVQTLDLSKTLMHMNRIELVDEYSDCWW